MSLAGVTRREGVDDDVFTLMLDSAEWFAEKYAGRTFSPIPGPDGDGLDTNPPVAKSFPARGRRRIKIPDLRTLTGISIDGGSTLVYGYDYDYEITGDEATAKSIVLSPQLFFPIGQPGLLTITGRWGFWPEAPPTAKELVLMLCARKWKKRSAGWTDILRTAEGAELFWTKDMPEDIRAALDMFNGGPRFAIC